MSYAHILRRQRINMERTESHMVVSYDNLTEARCKGI